jgi:restriction endonuclease S subunit
MHTIVDHNNVSVYMFNDEGSANVQITTDHLVFEGQVVDTTLNTTNCQLVDIGTTAPADWIGRKYCYSSGNWTANPNDPAAHQ